MKKKVLYILAVLVLVALGGIFGGQAWLKSRFEKEALIAQIERQLNCRVQIDGSSASILCSPAKVELLGIKFASRDSEVEKPVKLRAKLGDNLVAVSAERAVLLVVLSDLIKGKVNIKSLKFEGVGVRGGFDKEGRNSLQPIFVSPNKKKLTSDDQSHATDPAEGKKPHEKKEPGTKAEEEERPFHAGDLPVSVMVDVAGISNAQLDFSDERHGTRMMIENVRFDLKDMDVNPVDLAKHNRCQMEFDGQILLKKTGVVLPLMDFTFRGDGTLKPFDVQSGEWSPDVWLRVKLQKGAVLGGTPMKEQMRENDSKKLKDYGLDLGNIALGGVLGEDADTEIHRVRDKLIVKKDTRLVFPQYEITLADGSWFNGHQDEHRANGNLLVNADVTANILNQSQKALAVKYGDTIASLAMSLLNTALLDDQKRLVLKFKSRGKLSQPEVSLDNVLNDIKDLLKDTGTSLLNGLLK